MTVDELLDFIPDFGTKEDAVRFLGYKIPTWSTSIVSHALHCKCLGEIRFGDLSVQEYKELENMHNEIRAYFQKTKRETEIRKAALKYDC